MKNPIHIECVANGKGIRWVDEKGYSHREGAPAVIWESGVEQWMIHGVYHREDGPCWTAPSGCEQWVIHGKMHREDGPAIIDPAKGRRQWCLNGIDLSDDQTCKHLRKLIDDHMLTMMAMWRVIPLGTHEEIEWRLFTLVGQCFQAQCLTELNVDCHKEWEQHIRYGQWHDEHKGDA